MFNGVIIKVKKTRKRYTLSIEEIAGRKIATLTLAEIREIGSAYDDNAIGSDELERDEYCFIFKEATLGQGLFAFKRTGDERFALELSPDLDDAERFGDLVRGEIMYVYAEK